MRVLVACEFSGTVRDAFLARGHDAVSVDLLPTEAPGPHRIGDALAEILEFRPELLIAHPPCTYLALSGVRWLYRGGRGSDPDPERWSAMRAGAALFRALLEAPVPRIAVENPIMHGHALVEIGPHDGTIQTVQPWQYGHGETKATRFWLRNLPELRPTAVVEGRTPRVHHASPGPDRWKVRSRTYPGIAAAMAEQWGELK